jgi:hypothetical protein
MVPNPETSDARLPDRVQRLRNDYLELIQACLTGSAYRDVNEAPFGHHAYDAHLRERGLDWPAHAQTMIGEKRLANLRALTESVLADNVPGDLIETGVWRGGACILMRAVLYAYDVHDRTVWAADSFAGLPPANARDYPADAGSDFHTYEQLAVRLEEVQENFRAYGLLDGQTKFLKGWFKDTLPTAPIGQFALLRLDGDMYESTMDALTNLYPKLSEKGYVIVDDYHAVAACKAAVHDYCVSNGFLPEIVDIDGVGVYWRKQALSGHRDERTGPPQAAADPATQLSRLHDAIARISRLVMDQLNRSLDERDADVSRLREEISRLTASQAELHAVVSRLQEEMAAVYASRSWRITEPLRIAGTYLRSLRSGPAPIERPSAGGPSLSLHWDDDKHLRINDVRFRLSYDTDDLMTGQKSEDTFLLGKPRHMIEKSVAIGQQRTVTKIFEMGILKGGSIVLYDLIYRPVKIAAIDHDPKPVDMLTRYIRERNKSDIIRPYYGVNQADRPSLEKVLTAEFPKKDIDLIIDDASHLYEETREAFNIAFPFLKEGGLYVIEDWAWAHWDGDYWQKEQNTHLAGKKALSNLAIELSMLAASRPDLIQQIYLDHNVIIVTRGDGRLPKGKFNIADHYLLRGRRFSAPL